MRNKHDAKQGSGNFRERLIGDKEDERSDKGDGSKCLKAVP